MTAETTLRLRTQADLGGLREYVDLMGQAEAAAMGLRGATGRRPRGGGGGGTAGGGGGGAGSGSPGQASASGPSDPATIGIRELLFGARRGSPGQAAAASAVHGGGFGGAAAGNVVQAGGFAKMGGRQLFKMGTLAAGIGLGGGLLSTFLGAGHKYAALDKILITTKMRFDDFAGSVAKSGQALGYTIAQAGGLAETLGAGTNSFDKGQFTEMLGVARFRGIDAGLTTDFAAGGARRGRKYGRTETGALLGLSEWLRTDQGRLPEQFQAFNRMAQLGFSARGPETAGETGGVFGALTTPGMIFGNSDPRAQGSAGADFAGRLHGVLTGGNRGMKTFLMRAMGYGTGKPGSPNYIEMRKRMEAGIFDSRNLDDTFSLMQGQGYDSGQMFRAWEGIAGGQLKAHEIEQMVGSLGTKEGLAAYRKATGPGATDELRDNFLANLGSDEERALFKKLGFAGLGAKGVGAGAAHDVLGERRALKIGPKALASMDNLTRAADNIIELLGKVVGGDIIVKATEALVDLTDAVNRATNPHELPPGMNDMTTLEQITELDPPWKVDDSSGAYDHLTNAARPHAKAQDRISGPARAHAISSPKN